MSSSEMVKIQLEKFGDKLKSDEHLFAIVDLRLPEEQQIPRVITGVDAEGFIKNQHYHIEYIGENETSDRKLLDKRREETKQKMPSIKVPVSLSERLKKLEKEQKQVMKEKDELADENEEYAKRIAELEALVAGASQENDLSQDAEPGKPKGKAKKDKEAK